MSTGWGVQIEKDGKKQSLWAWAHDTGIAYETLRDRRAKGMSVEEILCTVRSRGARKPRSAHDPIAARAYGLLKGARENSRSPWAGLWACIVL